MCEDILVKKLIERSNAIKEGHFLLASGLHSNKYIQCSYLSRFPWITEELIKILARKVSSIEFDVVVSPAVGAIVFGYELARKLKKLFLYSERVEGKMQLRRDFKLEEGQKVLIVEDVITTGGSALEVAELIKKEKAKLVAFSSIFVRGETPIELSPVFYLFKIILAQYQPSDCPLCRTNIPLQIPGRKQLEHKNYQSMKF